jgi:hypothetical protein
MIYSMQGEGSGRASPVAGLLRSREHRCPLEHALASVLATASDKHSYRSMQATLLTNVLLKLPRIDEDGAARAAQSGAAISASDNGSA